MMALRFKSVLVLGALLIVLPATAGAQSGDSWASDPMTSSNPQESTNQPAEFQRVGVSGPRFGLTYVPGDSKLAQHLAQRGMEPVLSQFGWHFESRVTPKGGGPEFVIETVPLVAGVEYGKFLPSITLAMGVRFPRGWEFGIGPNLMITGTESSSNVSTSLVTAVGYSFRYSGVSLPVNLAFTTNPDGNRVTLLFGYAIRR